MAEMEIYQKFDQIAGDKTAVYISHRLSSCRFRADSVLYVAREVISGPVPILERA